MASLRRLASSAFRPSILGSSSSSSATASTSTLSAATRSLQHRRSYATEAPETPAPMMGFKQTTVEELHNTSPHEALAGACAAHVASQRQSQMLGLGGRDDVRVGVGHRRGRSGRHRHSRKMQLLMLPLPLLVLAPFPQTRRARCGTSPVSVERDGLARSSELLALIEAISSVCCLLLLSQLWVSACTLHSAAPCRFKLTLVPSVPLADPSTRPRTESCDSSSS